MLNLSKVTTIILVLTLTCCLPFYLTYAEEITSPICHVATATDNHNKTGIEPRPFTITFNAGDKGTPNQLSKEVIYESKYGTLPGATPTSEYDTYGIDGWFTDEEYTTEITADTDVTITDDQTLYAKWHPLELCVYFGGGPNDGIWTRVRVYKPDGTYTDYTGDNVKFGNRYFTVYRNCAVYMYHNTNWSFTIAATASASQWREYGRGYSCAYFTVPSTARGLATLKVNSWDYTSGGIRKCNYIYTYESTSWAHCIGIGLK